MTTPEVLDGSAAARARAALDRHAWREAFDLLVEADANGRLGPVELDLLADSAWWVGQPALSIESRERAYAAFMKAGEPVAAAASAVKLAHDHLLKSSHSIASAWLNRAERLLTDLDETPVHGWLAATHGFSAFMLGDVDGSLDDATRAHEIGVRTGDADLQAFALNGRGRSLLAMGNVQEGLALLDEATVSAVAGELEPATAGVVYCATIGACAAVGDWQRAAQWTEAQDRWCQREQINGFPGMCRLHRAEIKRLRGAWLEAETEARRAADELESFIPAAVGLALYEIGEIRLRRGDLPAAEDALFRAQSLGRDPEPALSLLRLAEGKIESAAASIRRTLEHPAESGWDAPPESDLSRLPLLPAQVEIALAVGDTATARTAADELDRLTERFTSVAVRASAACARGSVELAEGDIPAAIRSLRAGLDLWIELDAPFEASKARMSLAEAYRLQGDAERAAMELETARSGFERLGASLHLRIAEEALAGTSTGAGRPGRAQRSTRKVRTFMFTDIVDSTKLVELLGDEAWDHLSRWHDQTLRSLIAEHGGEEIKTIGDGFFVAFERPDAAIETAVMIHRRLAEHRQASGFAPGVRIGIHQAEATRKGQDYAGKGVNLAARIGALATRDEILVSLQTLDASARPFAHSASRSVSLRGLSDPVDVAGVEWR
jgi:class 3 adenylate cyclase